jgi:glycosyltransferase involved in cell wall biosynthesis
MDVSTKKIIIATHELVYGAPQALREYLECKKAGQVIFIAHPLQDDGGSSYIEVSKVGGSAMRIKSAPERHSFVLAYFIHVWRSFAWAWRYGGRADLFVGVDPLNALAGILLRAIGRARRVVYYTIDFTPNRFPSSLLNRIYHALDQWCVKHSDETWNVSPRIVEGREKVHGVSLKLRSRQYVVPIGVWYDRVSRLPYNQIKRHQLFFLGHLLEKQGVQLVLQALPKIVAEIPNFHFLIVGGGEYELTLRALVHELGIEKYVTFVGWIKSRAKLDQLMADSAMAIAMYDRASASFTTYADPTKLKDYLSAGLPIILTDVPYNARDLELAGCARVIDPTSEAIADAVIDLMRRDDQLYSMRERALQYIINFDWPQIFSPNLDRVLALKSHLKDEESRNVSS